MKKRVKINLFHKTTLFTRNMTSNFFKAKFSENKCLVLTLLLLKYCKQRYTFNRLLGWGAFGREYRTIRKLNASYDRLSTGNKSAFQELILI